MHDKTGGEMIMANLFSAVTYRAGTDTEPSSAAGSALWAQEGLEEFTKALARKLGVDETEVSILAVPQARYTPGICGGTIRVGHGGTPLNIGVFDGPDAGERTARALTPVMV